MRNTKKIISTILLTGVLMGCTPAEPSSTTAIDTSTKAGTTGAGTTTAGQTTGGAQSSTSAQGTQTPIITKAIDPNIILAQGDGILITSGQIEEEFNKMLDSMRAQYSPEMVDSAIGTLQNQKSTILEQYLRNELLNKKADELGFKLDDAEAMTQFDQIMKDNIASFGGEQQFNEAMAKAGFTKESYKMEVLKSLRYEKVAEEVTKEITVTEDEINKTYEEVKAKEYTQQPGATLYHIFFGDPKEVPDAEEKAKEARQKLDAGTAFADLAKEYGKDPTAEKEGLLGVFPYKNQELAPDFMNEALKLGEGEVSQPVKTTFGWHLIKAENVQKEPKVLALTDTMTLENGQEIKISENIRLNLMNEKRNNRLAELFKEWETTWNVKKYLDKIPMEVEEEPVGESTQTQSQSQTQSQTQTQTQTQTQSQTQTQTQTQTQP